MCELYGVIPEAITVGKFAIKTPRRPNTVGCVSYIILFEAIIVGTFAIRNPRKTYHCGLIELYCIL
jgi:hypothetical protein